MEKTTGISLNRRSLTLHFDSVLGTVWSLTDSVACTAVPDPYTYIIFIHLHNLPVPVLPLPHPSLRLFMSIHARAEHDIATWLNVRDTLRPHTGLALRLRVHDEIKRLCGWSSELNVFFPHLESKPTHKTIQLLGAATVWNLIENIPSKRFHDGLYMLQKEIEYLSRRPAHPLHSEIYEVLMMITACYTILTIRHLAVGGRRKQMQARGMSHTLPARVQHALVRTGTAQFLHVVEVYEFMCLQIKGIIGKNLEYLRGGSFIYQLGGQNLYVGQGRICRATGGVSGVVGRFREHLRNVQRMQADRPVKEHVRYRTLLQGSPGIFLMLIVCLVPTSEATQTESAIIHHSRPAANNLPHTPLGRHRAYHRLRRRRGRFARRHPIDTPESLLEHSVGWTQRRIESLVERASGHARYLARKRKWQLRLGKPFGDLYDHFLGKPGQNSVGPIDIYSPTCSLLLLRWGAPDPRRIVWQRLFAARPNGFDYSYTFWALSHLLPNFHDRLRLQSSLLRFLGYIEHPKPRGSVLKVSCVADLIRTRAWLKEVFNILRPTRPAWCQFTQLSLRVQIIPPTNFRKEFSTLARRMKHLSVESLGDLTDLEWRLMALGADMIRLPINGRVDIPPFASMIFRRARNSTHKWMEQEQIDQGSIPFLPRPGHQVDAREPSTLASQASMEIEKLAEQLETNSREFSCAVQDKDPNTLWLTKPIYMLGRWLGILSQAPDRWCIAHVSKQTIVEWYRLMYDLTVPKSLRARGEGAISENEVPYCYPTIKRKCWDPDVQCPPHCRKICEKPSHSRFRNICSFIHLPSRKLYRLIGRALIFLVNFATPGWSFEGLDQAIPNIVVGFGKTDEHFEYTCQECGQFMSHPGGLTADAGQAYEAINVSYIWQSVDHLFERVSKLTNNLTITVLRTRRSHVFLGGSIQARLWDRCVFLISSIRRCITGFMGMRYFFVASICLMQCKGIPIGGPISGAVLHLVLSRLEWQYEKAHFWTKRSIYKGRYADDVIMLSRRLCYQCLKLKIQSVYGRVLQFSVEPQPERVLDCIIVPYLEAELHINFTEVRIWVNHKNEKFAITGCAPDLSKQSVPPYLGHLTPVSFNNTVLS